MERIKSSDILEKIYDPENESEVLIAYAKCQGKAPKNVDEAREHVIHCGWCKKHFTLCNLAKENKVFINQG